MDDQIFDLLPLEQLGSSIRPGRRRPGGADMIYSALNDCWAPGEGGDELQSPFRETNAVDDIP